MSVETLSDLDPHAHDLELQDRFRGVLAEAGVDDSLLQPLTVGETPVDAPQIIRGTYDPRGEGEDPGVK